KRFYLAEQLPDNLGRFDLALSLDVIYHLIEEAAFEHYMRSLFSMSSRFVIIYSSNTSTAAKPPHVRHREFTLWITRNEPAWRQIGYLANKYPYDHANPDETSFANFYFFERIDGSRGGSPSWGSRVGS